MRLNSYSEPGQHHLHKQIDAALLQSAQNIKSPNSDHRSGEERLAQFFGQDTLNLSTEAIKLRRSEEAMPTAAVNDGKPCCSESAADDKEKQNMSAIDEERGKALGAQEELNVEEKRVVQQLRARDREVRAHEQAHVAASGRIAVSGPRYSYEEGPDGKRYATGGTVNFQVPPANSPEEEARLAAQLRRMALAPANPSGTDRAVAAGASAKESQARRDANKQRMEESSEANQVAAEASEASVQINQETGSVSEKSKLISYFDGDLNLADIWRSNSGGGSDEKERGTAAILNKVGNAQAYNKASGNLKDSMLINYTA